MAPVLRREGGRVPAAGGADEHRHEARGLAAGTWQHECDHLDGVLITDRADPATLATWDEFERYHRDAFIERISRFNESIGS